MTMTRSDRRIVRFIRLILGVPLRAEDGGFERSPQARTSHLIRSLPFAVLTRKLAFAAGSFDLGFQFDRQLANSRLAHGFQPTQCFFDNSSLIFRKIGLARDAAELAFVITGARRSHSFDRGLI